MKCKKCGSEFLTGAKVCPHCGERVDHMSRKNSVAFDWSGDSGSAAGSKKSKDMTIDWKSGKIYDRTSGQVFSQTSHSWSEPEEAKALFHFSQSKEQLQETLDQQMEEISESQPAYPGSEMRSFELPSSMGMGEFEALLNDAEVSLVNESGEVRYVAGAEKKDSVTPEEDVSEEEPESAIRLDKHTAVNEVVYERNHIKRTPADEQDEAFSFLQETEESSGEKSGAENAVFEEQQYTSEEENQVYAGLKNLMKVDERLREDMDRVSVLSPEEMVRVETLEERSKKLTLLPTVSFRTLEDEYADYCDMHGISTKIEKDGEASDTKDKNKEVEIKINEPSGTKVTVKTQELSLSGRSDLLSNEQTREVELDEIIQPPKNVQVSVEVSAAKGNASVEVTRRHDGATLVKTVDNGNEEHLYMNQEQESDVKEAANEETAAVSEEAPAEASASDAAEKTDTPVHKKTPEEENADFWECADHEKRLTITDIFGPEARDILNQIDSGAEKKSRKKSEDQKPDLRNSMMLEIKPEDIAITAAQTQALYTVSMEKPPTYMGDEELHKTADIIHTRKMDEIHPDQKEKTTKLPKTPDSDDVKQSSADEKAGEELQHTKDLTAEKLPSILHEDLKNESDKKKEKTDKILKKEQERQKKKAEKEQKKPKVKEVDTASRGINAILKVLVIVLAIVLVVEFSILGIKLFMPDSQPAVFLDKVGNSMHSVFSSDEAKKTDKNAEAASQQSTANGGTAVTDGSAAAVSGGTDAAAEQG